MLRKLLRVTVAGLLGLGAAVICYNASNAADEKVPDIKLIMKKSFGKKDGYNVTIPAAAKSGKWDDATKLAKEWTDLGVALGKNKAKKGEVKSWEEQCTKFCDNTKVVLKACEDKDAKAVDASLKTINTSCGACHKPHK